MKKTVTPAVISDPITPESAYVSRKLSGTPDFLLQDFIVEQAKIGRLNQQAIAAMLQLAAIVSASSERVIQLNTLRELLFEHGITPDTRPNLFPSRLESWTEAETWGGYALLVLAGFPACIRNFTAQNLRTEVIQDTLSDLAIWLEHFHREKNISGIPPRILQWEYGLLTGRIYRLGRLQFGISSFPGRIRVFRHRRNHRIQALAEPGIRFNSEGQFDGVNNRLSPSFWTSSMKITKRSITGNPVDPAGNARNISITMPTSEWEEVLSPGMAVFDIHIPAGEPLTTGDCGDSMLMAVDFFRDRIIEQSIRAFSCISWLLDIQLAGIMPPDGNIGKFQRELYKFPVDADGDESYRRIFGEDFNKKDLQNAPCGTRMQQAALALLNSGGNLRSGGGFFMIDDLPFGQQRYRGFDRP